MKQIFYGIILLLLMLTMQKGYAWTLPMDIGEFTHTTGVAPASGKCNLYFKNDNKLYKYCNGVSELPVGSGSGGGLDAFLSEDYETTQSTDFGTGNNAAFLTAGTINGAISNETASPIAGTRSIKYTASTASTNDWISSPAITLDAKQRGQYIGISFYYKWSGSVDVPFVVKCTAGDTATFTDSLDVVSTASSSTRFSTSIFISSACTEIKYGFHLTNAPTSGDILIWDDVELSTNPFVYKNLVNTTSVQAYGNAGQSITASTTAIPFTEVSDNSNAWSGDTYTVQNSNSVLKIDGSTYFTTSAIRYISIYKNGTLYHGISAGTVDTNQKFQFTSKKGEFSSGDLITIKSESNGGTLVASDTYHYINIVEQWESEHIVTPSKSNMTDSLEYVPTVSGLTIANYKFWYWRVGQYLHVQGLFEASTVAASEVQIGLPSGLTIDSGILDTTTSYLVGHSVRNSLDTSSKSMPILATGGDTFLNLGGTDTLNGLSPQNGSTIIGAGQFISFFAKVPIQGWSSDVSFLGAIPLFIYAVDVDASEALTNNDKNFISSCTNADPSVCTIQTGFFKEVPRCWANVTSAGSIASVTSTTITSTTIDRTDASTPFTLFCKGRLND